MHTRLTTRIKHAALKAARPTQRRIMRALRHHATRTRQLAQLHQAASAQGIRAWFGALFATLRAHAAARRFSLRTLLPRPPVVIRALTAHRKPAAPRQGHGASRRPRRLAASAGWFAFAAR